MNFHKLLNGAMINISPSMVSFSMTGITANYPTDTLVIRYYLDEEEYYIHASSSDFTSGIILNISVSEAKELSNIHGLETHLIDNLGNIVEEVQS